VEISRRRTSKRERKRERERTKEREKEREREAEEKERKCMRKRKGERERGRKGENPIETIPSLNLIAIERKKVSQSVEKLSLAFVFSQEYEYFNKI
jgi:hypothetical protein